MFINELTDLTKLWHFRLIDGVEVVGTIVSHVMDVYGHILMVRIFVSNHWTDQMQKVAEQIDVPWTSVVYVKSYVEVN